MRLKRGSLKNIKLIVLYFNIFILTACFGIKSSPNPANEENLDNLNKRLNQHAEQIEQIQQKLISYQTIINNYSHVNDEISQVKHEVKTTLDKLQNDSMEQEFLNILNKIQKK